MKVDTSSCIIEKNKVLVSAFSISAVLYVVFLGFRGFGWDGDSLISAAQFVKLINPKLYGLDDFGTHPKFLCILIFGLFYKFTNSLVWLTYLSILINSFMIAVICKWVDECDGIWWLALIGIMTNASWSLLVVNCDNPAFSIPTLIIGLYYYFHQNKKTLSLFLLLASSLFRPGAEIVMMFILFFEFYNGNKNIKLYIYLFAVIALCLVNTLYGTYIAYPSQKQFIDLCVYNYNEYINDVSNYRYSIDALIPYLKSVIKLINFDRVILVYLVLVSAYFAFIKKINTDINYIACALLSTLILPIGTFVYGTTNAIDSSKHMELLFVIVTIGSMFNPLRTCQLLTNSCVRPIISCAVIFFLLIFNVNSGIRFEGYYEVNNDGSGILGWKQRSQTIGDKLHKDLKYNALVSPSELIYFILDYGGVVNNITIFKKQLHGYLDYSMYNIVLYERNYIANISDTELSKFTSNDIGDGIMLLINNPVSR